MVRRSRSAPLVSRAESAPQRGHQVSSAISSARLIARRAVPTFGPALAGMGLLLSGTVQAATIMVDTDASGDGVVIANSSDGYCSLIEAIQNANADTSVAGAPGNGECEAGAGADEIVLPDNASFTLDNTSVPTPFESFFNTSSLGLNGLPEIGTTVTIEGNNSEIARATGATEFRILSVVGDDDSDGDLTLNELTLRGGVTSGPDTGLDSYGGGMINVGGDLTGNHLTVVGNTARSTNSGGGGIFNFGALTLNRSTVSDNTAFSGGGINCNSGSFTLSHSSVSGNMATRAGGIRNGCNATLTHSSIVNNYAQFHGGLYQDSTTVTLRNSLVAANAATSGSPNCHDEMRTSSRTVTLAGVNLTNDDSTNTTIEQCGLAEMADLTLASSGMGGTLGDLADNGGPTQTHLLLDGSSAIDAAVGGDAPGGGAVCADTFNGSNDDQRGVNRPQGTQCDVGAFEVVQDTITLFSGDTPGFFPNAATLPDGVCFATITAHGGHGGRGEPGEDGSEGGLGAQVSARFDFTATPGVNFDVNVAGAGGDAGGSGVGGDGGFGGGGGGGANGGNSGGGGGGASVVSLNPSAASTDLLLVAGGGGGGCSGGNPNPEPGGNGGLLGDPINTGVGGSGGRCTNGVPNPPPDGGSSTGNGGNGGQRSGTAGGGGGGVGTGGAAGSANAGSGGNGDGVFGGGGGGGVTTEADVAGTDGTPGGSGTGLGGNGATSGGSMGGGGGTGNDPDGVGDGGGNGGNGGSTTSPGEAAGGGGAGGFGFAGGGGSSISGGGGGGYGAGGGGGDNISGAGGASVLLPDSGASVSLVNGSAISMPSTREGDGLVTITYNLFDDLCDGVDGGDAPTAAQSGFARSYPTLREINGPLHFIQGPFLGNVPPDREADDGLPDANALGDDNNGANDEDALSNVQLTIGTGMATVSVPVTPNSSPVFGNAWVDLNQDGDWDDSGEQLAEDVDAGSGSFDFPVPLDADVSPGDVFFARLRVCDSTDQCNTPTGIAESGEVEDHRLTVPRARQGIGDDDDDDGSGATSPVDLAMLLPLALIGLWRRWRKSSPTV